MKKSADKTKAFQEDIISITNLFKSQSASNQNEWTIYTKPLILVEFFGRQDYIFENSRYNEEEFTDGQIFYFNVVGYFIVPGKILVFVG